MKAKHTRFDLVTYIGTLQVGVLVGWVVRACRARLPRRGTSWSPAWSAAALRRCVRRTAVTPSTYPIPPYQYQHAIGPRHPNDNIHHAPQPISSVGYTQRSITRKILVDCKCYWTLNSELLRRQRWLVLCFYAFS